MAGPSLYYGMNALSHNVIMADRKKLNRPTACISAPRARQELRRKARNHQRVSCDSKDRIIIVDPMGEYAPLVRRLGGQVVEIAPGSPSHINPMDIQP